MNKEQATEIIEKYDRYDQAFRAARKAGDFKKAASLNTCTNTYF